MRRELSAVGSRKISLDRLTGNDAYLAIFTPPPVATLTQPEAMVACRNRRLPMRAKATATPSGGKI